jgi:hypothetical protein
MEFANYLVDNPIQVATVSKEFGPIATRIASMVSRLIDLNPQTQRSEVIRTKLALHRLNLFSQRADILSVLGESEDSTERATLAKRYDDVTDAIRASDAEIARSEASGVATA